MCKYLVLQTTDDNAMYHRCKAFRQRTQLCIVCVV